MGGRDAEAGEVLDRAIAAVRRHRGRKPALAVAERTEPRQLGPGFGQEILAGDPEVGDAVADELDHVVRPDEQDVEIEVPNAGHQAALVVLEDEARVSQQLDARLDEAALVGNGQTEPLAPLERGHDSRPAG